MLALAKNFLNLCNDRGQEHLLIHKHWIAHAYTFCKSPSCTTSSKRYRLNPKFEGERERVFQILLYLYFYSKSWFILAFPYLYPICLQSYNEVFYAGLIQYVLYLEYSTFCDKLFCRAQYQLSLTDRMDCKSQKGRIGIGNITRNSDEKNHNCRLNNQKYFIDTRSFKCIN